MQIIVEAPDRFGEKLQRLGDQRPKILDFLLQNIPNTETIS